MAVSISEHQGSDAQARHKGGECRQGAPDFMRGPLGALCVGHEMVGVPNAIPACALNVLCKREHGIPGLAVHGPEAESHVLSLSLLIVKASYRDHRFRAWGLRRIVERIGLLGQF